MKVTQDEKSISELKTKLKRKFPSLTNNDFLITNNDLARMLTMVAYKLRKSKEEMSEIVDKL
jgi:tRNA(Phe) wybutosine-synthesizing methylase Tyw3